MFDAELPFWRESDVGSTKTVSAATEPQELHIPELLWRDRALTEGARYLWCYLWMLVDVRTFTYAELRRGTGISQHSLLKYLRQLTEAGWLRCTRTSLRTVTVEVLWPRTCEFLRLPADILLDRRLPHPAKWVWAVIRRLNGEFDYQLLGELTGYSRNSLIKYIRALQKRGWLSGQPRWRAKRKWFDPKVENPRENRRVEALQNFLRAREAALKRQHYSVGQFYSVQIIEMLTQARLVENRAASWLDNEATGGRLEYDVLLIDYNAAFEFQGPQHERATELYPGEDRLRAQKQRDQLKRELSLQAGIRLTEIWAGDLSFERIGDMLTALGIPLKPIPDEMRYVYHALVRFAARYREAAARQPADM